VQIQKKPKGRSKKDECVIERRRREDGTKNGICKTEGMGPRPKRQRRGAYTVLGCREQKEKNAWSASSRGESGLVDVRIKYSDCGAGTGERKVEGRRKEDF